MHIAANRNIGEHATELLAFLRQRQSENVRCALVTIVDFVGSSSRCLGSHMVVCESGEYVGSVSSGCLDGNVAAVALQSIEDGLQKKIRFGEGSPFVDVKLPCGGGVELLIIPDPNPALINTIVDVLLRREECSVLLCDDGLHVSPNVLPTNQLDVGFCVHYEPRLKIIAAGRGYELNSMVNLSVAAGFEVIALGPDQVDLEVCEKLGGHSQQLDTIDMDPMIQADQWTAIILLFHDHEWEQNILISALNTSAFYIGALGSRQTHANRLDGLRREKIAENKLRQIRGPIGLVPSQRNTSMLAISALAEIIETFRQKVSST